MTLVRFSIRQKEPVGIVTDLIKCRLCFVYPYIDSEMALFVMILFACISSSISLQHNHVVSDGHSLEYYLCQDGLHIESVQTLIVPAAVNHTVYSVSVLLQT